MDNNGILARNMIVNGLKAVDKGANPSIHLVTFQDIIKAYESNQS